MSNASNLSFERFVIQLYMHREKAKAYSPQWDKQATIGQLETWKDSLNVVYYDNLRAGLSQWMRETETCSGTCMSIWNRLVGANNGDEFWKTEERELPNSVEYEIQTLFTPALKLMVAEVYKDDFTAMAEIAKRAS